MSSNGREHSGPPHPLNMRQTPPKCWHASCFSKSFLKPVTWLCQVSVSSHFNSVINTLLAKNCILHVRKSKIGKNDIHFLSYYMLCHHTRQGSASFWRKIENYDRRKRGKSYWKGCKEIKLEQVFNSIFASFNWPHVGSNF